MYFTTNLYSALAWKSWNAKRSVSEVHRHPTTDYKDQNVPLKRSRARWFKKITFDPVDTFAQLLERVNFLQLMNKRYVLYFRGQSANYGLSYGYGNMDFPSLLRPPVNCKYLDIDLFEQRWSALTHQSTKWRELLSKDHPRLRTMDYFPEAIWAIQQHYKDLLDKMSNQTNAAASILTDVTQSIRTATVFALAGRESNATPYISVVALPQTTGSITFDADQQLSIMRLSALCPPAALRPQLQEGLLVGRFPLAIDHLRALVKARDLVNLEEFYSLRRRMVAVIPINLNRKFWGAYGKLAGSNVLTCPWFKGRVKPNWKSL